MLKRCYIINNRRIFSRCFSNKERQGFGSFHSDDIDILSTMNENEYKAIYQRGYPPIYHDVKEIIDDRFKLSLSSLSPPTLYGKDCKRKLFVLDDSWVILLFIISISS